MHRVQTLEQQHDAITSQRRETEAKPPPVPPLEPTPWPQAAMQRIEKELAEERAAKRCHRVLCRDQPATHHVRPTRRAEEGLDQSRALLEKALVLNQQLVAKLQPGPGDVKKKKKLKVKKRGKGAEHSSKGLRHSQSSPRRYSITDNGYDYPSVD